MKVNLVASTSDYCIESDYEFDFMPNIGDSINIGWHRYKVVSREITLGDRRISGDWAGYSCVLETNIKDENEVIANLIEQKWSFSDDSGYANLSYKVINDKFVIIHDATKPTNDQKTP